MGKRIGLSMRVCNMGDYKEKRDCIAHDWYKFMQDSFPEVSWIPIPNLGPSVLDYIQLQEVSGLILTGGNDIGEEKIRDDTEMALIDFAIRNKLPVFGVCRGLQLIQHYYRGPIKPCDENIHVSTNHSVSFTHTIEGFTTIGGCRVVNSYHRQAVYVDSIAPSLMPWAITDDGCVEGLFHPDEKIVAVQWHPERTNPYVTDDQRLMAKVLNIR